MAGQGVIEFSRLDGTEGRRLWRGNTYPSRVGRFSDELTTSVLWLNDMGLNIRCVQISPYQFEGKVLVNVQQIIPIPETEDYQVRVRRKGEEKKIARYSDGRDYTRYKFKGVEYNKRRESMG